MKKKNFVFSFVIPLVCTIFARTTNFNAYADNRYIQAHKHGRTLRRDLAQIMHEAAIDAKKKGEPALKRYFDQLRRMANETVQKWTRP